jgi:hypothetical protein
MPILKFTFDNSKISLEKFRMEDITEDKRTQMLDKKSFLKKEYHIEHNVYMVVNDMFFKMSKFFNKTSTDIDAMLIKDEKNYIIIVPSRSYVFWNGRSVEPSEYKILDSEINIMKLLKI